MKVSIIVPIYNVEQYLRTCLDSVVAQLYSDIELLLINDGSTDNSVEISREYESNYPFVRLINKENGGLSDARNTGIRESKGDYLLFLDADDYWETDFLQELMERVQKDTKLDYVLFRYKKFYQNAETWEEAIHGKELYKLKGWSGIAYLEVMLQENRKFNWFAWQGLIRRNFILENELFFQSGKNYEDVLWTPEVLLKAERVDFYDKAFYVYRLEREGQITSNFSVESLKGSIYVSSFWYQKLQKLDLDRDLKNMLLNNLMTQFFVAIWFSGFLENQEKKELISILKKNRILLNYDNDSASKVTAMLCKVFGFKICTEILKRSIIAKRFFRQQHSLKNVKPKSEAIEQ